MAERTEPNQASVATVGRPIEVAYGGAREASALVDGTGKDGEAMESLQWKTGGVFCFRKPKQS